MILEATLTEVKRYTTKKDGSPLVTKAGKPYTSVRIKTDVTNDDILSGFENDTTKTWKVGDKVEIEVTKNGEYSNFALPKKGSIDGAILKDIYDNTETILNKMVGQQIKLEQILEAIKPQSKKATVEQTDYPEDFNEPAF